ncbi:hypothetical protein DICPUDRAFT_156617 [Dictyostelium purpureum]|uniref:Uncharacterized protein n=1 Tax=Dictyostelium purpureum TaxID=5786 RepID=F0ZX10_DICPU|nr:uncharacterized protein DICPUDRAFT_156617 [Dictyostelium purpureum]EGC31523.1 hypothetical protein DICPUDRAFT_156617 [Dictyostelium purpureum]|eukprot:XP_003291951.1 hypothetical protein DICPUDRAFT_156617 [Dictyostelium purpureum]
MFKPFENNFHLKDPHHHRNSGSTSISTGIIAGNSSDWKDSSDASEDSSRGTSDSRSSSAISSSDSGLSDSS